MKAKKASEAATLEQIPNVGKAVAQDLQNIGITRPQQLIGKDGISFLPFSGPFLAQILSQILDRLNPARSYPDKHPKAGGNYAVYFEDPDRIKVELVAPSP